MHTLNEVVIRADAKVIYALAAAVERWPALLPHYRSVRILEERGDGRRVAMSAYRDRIPVQWCAEQVCYPDTPRITYHHVGGITTGMDVEWTFSPGADGLRVAIDHEFKLGWPLVGAFVADRIIGPLFVENIAAKTLSRIKVLAEQAENDATTRQRP